MITFGEYISVIDSEFWSEIECAFTSKGKRKGLIKKVAPCGRYAKECSDNGRANMVWNACMLVLAPVRVQMMNTVLLDSKLKSEFDLLVGKFSYYSFELKATAQLPLEFNLFAMNYDIEMISSDLKSRVDNALNSK